MSTPPDVPVSRRQRVRDATTEEITATARVLLAEVGSAGLTLRAIARRMGMAPSALYRYFPSRDAILTALVMDAYDAVGQEVERAAAQAPVDATASAILAAVHAFRRWALEHPHEFGLIYGTSVPGYEAPAQTEAPAMRTPAVLLGLLGRALECGLITLPPEEEAVPAHLREAILAVADHKAQNLPLAAFAVAMQFWAVLLGLLSGEVFGHMPKPLIAQGGAFFDHTIRRALLAMGADPAGVAAAVSPPH